MLGSQKTKTRARNVDTEGSFYLRREALMRAAMQKHPGLPVSPLAVQEENKAGQLKKTIEGLKKTLKSSPDDVVPRHQLISLYIEEGQKEPAEYLIKIAIEDGLANAETYFLKGLCAIRFYRYYDEQQQVEVVQSTAVEDARIALDVATNEAHFQDNIFSDQEKIEQLNTKISEVEAVLKARKAQDYYNNALRYFNQNVAGRFSAEIPAIAQVMRLLKKAEEAGYHPEELEALREKVRPSKSANFFPSTAKTEGKENKHSADQSVKP